MFLKKRSTNGQVKGLNAPGNPEPSTSASFSPTTTASVTSTPVPNFNKRNGGVSFTNPWSNNHTAVYYQPRTLEDILRTASNLSANQEVSYPGDRTNSSNSDSGSANYDTENAQRRSQLFDILPFKDRSYSLAHPRPEAQHRKKSSVSIKPPPTLGGRHKTSNTNSEGSCKSRMRVHSPSPDRYMPRVAFGILEAADSVKNSTIGIVLRHQHATFKAEKLSRTFLVGLDDQVYSHDALKWLFDCMVDDGDSVVCFRVHDKEVKPGQEKQYHQEAQKVMNMIKRENTHNKAISITLEYSFGKLQTIFRKLISVHQPGMVIVGTKGKNNQGIQSVWTSRNSFSKYCLQYSPVPVVVVRPMSKRNKKKEKRNADPGRHEYRSMLGENHGVHELDIDLALIEKQMQNLYTSDEEAHHVARAIGLPASFDPLIKGIDPKIVGGRISAANSRSNSRPNSRPVSPSGVGRKGSASAGLAAQVQMSLERNGVAPKRLTAQLPDSAPNSAPASDDDSDISDADSNNKIKAAKQEARNEARQTKKKLHQMEVQEAQYLRKNWNDDDDDDDEVVKE